MGELVLTSNLDCERKEKMKQGRVKVIKKMHAGFKENENCLEALNELAKLNEALKDVQKVFLILVWLKLLEC